MRKLLILIGSSLFLLSSCTDETGNKKVDTKITTPSVDNNNVIADDEQKNVQTEKPKVLDLGDLMKEAVVYNPTNDEDYSDFNKTSKGLLYKFHRQGNDGELLTENDVVELEMNYYLNKRMLFTTSSYPKIF